MITCKKKRILTRLIGVLVGLDKYMVYIKHRG